MTMTPNRPHLVRGLYEWILENDCTPYVLVNAMEQGVEVPQEHVKDGQIILNISPTAVQDLLIGNEVMEFYGRFAGIEKHIFVPMSAVLGIYAKENGQGMIFDAEARPSPPPPKNSDANSDNEGKRRPSKKPSLRVVK